ncbi:MAG: phosphodiesterase [Rhodobacter sp.]|nr:phosphodiesterase [Rhodobacter sp.]
MKLIHLSDPHLVRPGQVLHGLDPAKRLSTCLDDIARWHGDAAFAVISGDLTDDGATETYTWLKHRLDAFPLRTFLILGNHDDRAAFLGVFGGHPTDANGFVQFRHDTEAGAFLFLDTVKPGAAEGAYCAARADWLAAELDAIGDAPSFIVMHHPPFEIGLPRMDRLRLSDTAELQRSLDHGRDIRHVFFGHVHRHLYVNWRGLPCTCLPSTSHQVPVTRKATGTPYSAEPPAYGIVTIGAGQVTVNADAYLHRVPLGGDAAP